MEKPFAVHLRLNPRAEALRSFAHALPDRFEVQGEPLHDGRNRIKAFETSCGKVAVKRYGTPNRLNRIVYSFLRKGKARRAYEHAARLRSLGIDTPEGLACVECRDRFGIVRESYFVARYTDDAPLSRAAAAFGLSETAAHVLDDFARFTASIHEKGVLHRDYNHTNVLYRTEPDGSTHFQLIDTNRMSFVRRASRRACLVNLRRLSCPAAAYLFIVSRYAAARGWDIDGNLLRSAVSRLLFERRQHLKSGIREHRHGGCAKKRTA